MVFVNATKKYVEKTLVNNIQLIKVVKMKANRKRMTRNRH